MSYEALFDEGSGGGAPFLMPPASVATPCLLPKAMMSSPGGLSLGLLSNVEAQRELVQIGIAGGGDMGHGREDDDSRSGSDNLGGLSGDELNEQENGNGKSRKRKRYHRHTPQQIQELEGLFKECPHPDEKQRMELSKRLQLAPRQVKFWFQNRRTQMKMQMERHENSLLRQENDRLRAENLSIRDVMRSPICTTCGGPAMLGEVSFEEQHLKIENARLKDELDRACAITEKFLGRPISSMAAVIPAPILSSSLELAVGGNGFLPLGSVIAALPPGAEFVHCVSGPLPIAASAPHGRRQMGSMAVVDRSLLLELALAAMEELVRLAQMGSPLWVPNLDARGKDTLSFDEYLQTFPRCIGMKPAGFVSEASRETGMVIINSLALVETLMDANRWAEMFPGVVAGAVTTEVISTGMGGTRNGVLQLMRAEFQILSPLVPVREVNFLRFCKHVAEGAWAVVDVSIDSIRENPLGGGSPFLTCRRLPSGCLVQDVPNGYSKVTWIEHAEYEEAAVHPLFRPLMRSGAALGAQRWLAALQRQCECLAILMSSNLPSRVPPGVTAAGRRSMLTLATRMTGNFCAGVCAAAARKWRRLSSDGGEEVRVMTRQSVDDPGEPPGVMLSAATSVWVPVAPARLFSFLRDEGLRSEWDILSNGGPMQEMAHIAKGQNQGNAVSLLRAGGGESGMLILQETTTDPSGSMVVYAPVDVPAMHLVMSGEDSTYVHLLPSGFVVLPDGKPKEEGEELGSLLTVAFQILVNSLPTAKLTGESVETVNNLISCTIQKIRCALHCETAP